MSYLLHFDLVDDLRQPGCPLCRAAERSGREYLRTLMATDITDTRVREDLRRAGGLCREHLFLGVDVAAEVPDSMGIALLEELLLDVGRRSLARRARRARRLPLPRRARTGSCPACDAESVVVDGYADLLLSDPRAYLIPMLKSSDRGLCLPHASRTLDRPGGAKQLRAVISAWSGPAERLHRLVEASIAAHRAGSRTPPSRGDERAVWVDAPGWLVGRRRSARTTTR